MYEDIFIKGIIKKNFPKEKVKLIGSKLYYTHGTYWYQHLNDVRFSSDVDESSLFDIGIVIEFEDSIVTIFKKVVVFEHGTDNIVGQVDSWHEEIKYVIGSLVNNIESDTKEARKILLEILLKKRVGNSKIDSNLMSPTLIPNFNFVRYIEDISDGDVSLQLVKGTTHPDYTGYSWYDIFYRLKRSGTIISSIILDNTYNTFSNNDFSEEKISYIQIDDVFFTSTGNHRTTIMKLINVSKISNCSIAIYKTDLVYKQAFDIIKNLGFDVEFPKGILPPYGVKSVKKYNWEVFIIELTNKHKLTLSGIEEIKKFIDIVSKLTVIEQIKYQFKRIIFPFKMNVYKNHIERFIGDNLQSVINQRNNRNRDVK